MNNMLIEPSLFIGLSTFISGQQVGISSAALMGGVLYLVDKIVDVEVLGKKTLVNYMNSKGYEANHTKQVCAISSIFLKCLVAGSISVGCRITDLSFVKVVGLVVVTYAVKTLMETGLEVIKEDIQAKKALAVEAKVGFAQAGVISQMLQDCTETTKKLMNGPLQPLGSVINKGNEPKKEKKISIVNGEIIEE